MKIPPTGCLPAILLIASPLWAAPVANPDTFTAIEDHTLNVDATGGVLENDTDTGGGTLSAILESDVSDGSLTLNADGSFTYTPGPNFDGTDTFTYRTQESPTGPQEFTIDQNSSAADVDVSVTIAPGTPIIGGDTGSDSARTALKGTLTADVVPSGSPFDQIHITDFEVTTADAVSLHIGFTVFFVEVAGIDVDAAPEGITIEMAQPGAPAAVDGTGNFTQLQNEVRVIGAVNVAGTGAAAGEVPAGPQALDLTGEFLDLNGTITQAGNTLTLAFPVEFSGVFDLDGNNIELDLDGNIVATSPVLLPEVSEPTTVTINVLSLNDPPSVTGETYTVASNSALEIPDSGVLDNDSDIEDDPLMATTHTPPTDGTLNLATGGGFTYTPFPGFVGTDSFIYAVQDSGIQLETRALLPFGDTWRFLDNGSDQGTTWRDPGFDDSTWGRGAGELGYGEDDQATTLDFGPDENNKFATTYFRNHFYLSNLTQLDDSVEIQMLRDDAAAIYINGTEIYRDTNLSISASFDSYASAGVIDENAFITIDVPLTSLVDGENTIAVEVHQASGTSTDLAFHLALTCAVPVESTLLPAGSEWRFTDAGIDLGSSWTAPGFDDSLWQSGAGEIGYGDGDEVTPLPTPANPKPITTYFRRTLDIPDASQVQTLAFELLRDDGAAIYINGTEAARDNLPDGATFATPASVGVGNEDESRYFRLVKVDPTLLQDGENTIAVEIHQSSATSSDISFDLAITASLLTSLGVASIEVTGLPFVDTDGDDMDDNWEEDNGLTVGEDDSGDDDDGDQRTNLEEFLALTKPQDPDSRLEITGLERGSPGEFTIHFTSTPGKTYQLQYSPDIVTPFTDVTDATLRATEPASSFTTAPPLTRGYFKVIIPSP